MVGWALDAVVGALIFLSSILSVKKRKNSVMSALCHERLTWPIDVSRGGKLGGKAGREMAKRARYGGEGCGWIWAGLRMRAYYYPGGNFQGKSAADPSRFRD